MREQTENSVQRSVLVLDDDESFRESLTALLRSKGWKPVIFKDPASFLADAESLPSSVLMLDIRMPGVSGVDLLSRSAMRRFAVIMMTGHGDVPTAVASLKAGAVDFLQKPFSGLELDSALDVASEALSRRTESRSREAAAKLSLLSSREAQVLERLLLGGTNKSIALSLGLSSRTVELYRAKLMSKLEVRTASELAYIAALGGFLAAPSD